MNDNSRKNRIQKKQRRRAVPFFVCLFSLAITGACTFLRPTESARERRMLAEFPDFSGEAFLSGEYFSDISLWYSDTFPGRDTWLNVNDELKALRGSTENAADPSLLTYVALSHAQQAAAAPEGAEVTAAPEVAPTAPVKPDAGEAVPEATPMPTPEPTPDQDSATEWSGMDLTEAENLLLGQVVQVGDMALDYFGYTPGLIDIRSALMNDVAEYYKDIDVDFYDVPAPTSVGVMVSSELMESVHCDSQGACITDLFAKEDDRIKKVNTFNNLINHNNEYIYFNTDHHWTALGAYYAYEQFCRVAGIESVPLAAYTAKDLGLFKGTLWDRAFDTDRLATDTVTVYYPPANVTAIRNSREEVPMIEEVPDVYVGTKYSSFLGGDYALTVLTNNDLPDDAPNCAVLKDSFGNPFVIYLTMHYKNVYVIDYRYFGPAYFKYCGRNHFPEFISEFNIKDVLVVQGLNLAMSEGGTGAVEGVLTDNY